MTTLGEVLTFAGVPERVSEPENETFVTVRLNGGGAVKRSVGAGKTPIAFTGYRVKDGQFVYSRIDARNGAFAIIPPDLRGAVVSKDFPVFDIRRDLVDPRYLNHFFRSGRPEAIIRGLSRGATNRQRVREDQLLELEIPLPSLDEQRRIAAILDQADAIGTKRRETLDHLTALQHSVFADMFDGLTDTTTFGSVCDRIVVGVVVRPASHYATKGVPALRTLNIKPGRLLLDDLVYFSESASNGPLRKSRLRSGDLVIARTGNTGTTAIVPESLDGANAVDIIIATPSRDVVLPVYLESFLNSEAGKRASGSKSRGQIQQHFNVGSLKAMELPVPSLNDQRVFAKAVARIDSLRTDVRHALSCNRELVASLQSRAFRGEL